ncbi:MAG: pyridoxal phosphate-dependent aminotransferase [Oscillospiraceae bacterium]|nr:pyridoxal phosphate-dependent aminotransferase [Oscillospiraceae bacterium]
MYDFDHGAQRRGTGCIKWDIQARDESGRGDLLPFSIADADYRTYPPVVEALKTRADNGVIGYADPDDRYFEAIEGWCERRHGWKIQRDWIVPVGGLVTSIAYCLEAMTSPGAKVIVQTPVYDPFFSVVEATGRTLVCNPLILDGSGYHIDFDGLRALAEQGAEFLIFCSPHNPVCRVWTKEELAGVAEICREYGIVIFSDEIHWDLILGGRTHVSMGLFPEIADQLIVGTSCSKTFNVAGLETSNLIIPGEGIRGKLLGYLYGRYLFSPNVMGMTAVKAAYKDGDVWVDEQKAYLTENAQMVVDFMKEYLPKVKVAEPQGTYLLWLDMTAYGRSDEELVQRIREKGAVLNGGKVYGEGYDGFLRMNVACPKSQLIAGLERIRAALTELEG